MSDLVECCFDIQGDHTYLVASVQTVRPILGEDGENVSFTVVGSEAKLSI